MEIQVDRVEFFRCISRVQGIIERKSNMPILSTILLTVEGNNLHISATDLEIGFQQIIQVNVIKEGNITISGRKLFEIVKQSKSNKINIKGKENNWVFISDEVAQFELACLAADEYPSFIEPEDVVMVEIEGDFLGRMIEQTIYAVSIDEVGFKLSGIFTQKIIDEENKLLRMVSTDGHRLSIADMVLSGVDNLDIGSGVMIPKKGMSELSKLASEGGFLQIGFKDNNCVIKREGILMVIRMLEAKFPDYKAVIPEDIKCSIKINRNLLMEAMRKMMILSSESYRAVKVSLKDDEMELISTNPDLGKAQEKIKIEYKGEFIEAGFNPKYFMDLLQAMNSEDVVMSFADNSKPCIIKGDDDKGFVGLIMPMRV